jgi:hypothetical protein
MVSLLLIRVWMDERRQWSPIDDKPRNESTKLFRGEQIDLKHADGMRSQWSVPDLVNAEFRDLCHALMLLVLERDMIRDEGQTYTLAVYAPRALLRISALLALTVRSRCVC